jgi:hypothetical protein
MPELTRFFGINIAMEFNNHSPPHFHAKYGAGNAVICMDSGEVIEGNLSSRALRLVEEWRQLHQQELLNDWALAQNRQPLIKIEPLE